MLIARLLLHSYTYMNQSPNGGYYVYETANFGDLNLSLGGLSDQPNFFPAIDAKQYNVTSTILHQQLGEDNSENSDRGTV